jgi:hypothetical protein
LLATVSWGKGQWLALLFSLPKEKHNLTALNNYYHATIIVKLWQARYWAGNTLLNNENTQTTLSAAVMKSGAKPPGQLPAGLAWRSLCGQCISRG